MKEKREERGMSAWEGRMKARREEREESSVPMMEFPIRVHLGAPTDLKNGQWDPNEESYVDFHVRNVGGNLFECGVDHDGDLFDVFFPNAFVHQMKKVEGGMLLDVDACSHLSIPSQQFSQGKSFEDIIIEFEDFFVKSFRESFLEGDDEKEFEREMRFFHLTKDGESLRSSFFTDFTVTLDYVEVEVYVSKFSFVYYFKSCGDIPIRHAIQRKGCSWIPLVDLGKSLE